MPDYNEIFEHEGEYYKKEPEQSTGRCDGCILDSTDCGNFRNSPLNISKRECNKENIIYVKVDPMLATLLEVKKITEEERAIALLEWKEENIQHMIDKLQNQLQEWELLREEVRENIQYLKEGE